MAKMLSLLFEVIEKVNTIIINTIVVIKLGKRNGRVLHSYLIIKIE